MKDSVLYKKVLGCLVGGACGDALGGPVEGMNANFIRQLHSGRVTEMVSYRTRPDDFFQPEMPSAYAWHDTPGTYTDDTYFSIQNALCIIQKGGRINCEDLADFWVKNFDVNRAWFSTSNSYHKLELTHLPARDVGEGTIGENSSAMCIGPIGAINAGNPAQAAQDAYDVVSFMHWGHSREAAAILAAAVAEAFNPDATVESIMAAACDNIPNGKESRMYNALHLGLDLARKAKDSEELTQLYYDQLIIDWTGRGMQPSGDGRHEASCEAQESIPCALGMILNSKGDPRESIVSAANFGRDCDSIACMVGYVVGALHGIDGLPQSWVQAVMSANPEGPNLEELAVQFTQTLEKQLQADSARCQTVLGMAQA